MKIKRKIVSAALALLLAFSHVIYIPFVARAADSAKSDGYVSLDGVHLNYENTLTDLKDGTYQLSILAESTFQMEETNTHSTFSQDGFYQAEKDGTYLIELWGGDGATISPDGTSLGSGGLGGAGGYIYATIELKAGDILFYSLGGDGQKTNSSGQGGGANGVGGTHGGSGSTSVGGGGGYSAVYLFDEADFAARYLDNQGELVRTTILESDRVSRYIMIAGGGGGAGAFSMDTTALPNGGAGGSINHASGVLSGSAYDVEGTFFVGQDGASSGGNTTYAGKGGSNRPGAEVGTLLGWTETESPNDWRGTYNNALTGGAGGAGNLRGGSGGAGFCGGSGGVMASFILPNNVGGGGGGSSFISSLMTYQLNDEEKAALTGVNSSKTGGAVCITYMEEEDISYLDNLILHFNTTKYFSVVSAEATNSVTGETVRAVLDSEEHAEYAFTNLRARIGEQLEIKLVFAPMVNFAGGNNVPLFEHGKIYVETSGGNEHGSGEIKLQNACAYVNVPLNFTVHVQNHNTNDAGHSHNVADLYVDNYAGVRDNLSSYAAQYNFIESIGTYQVSALDGTILPGDGAVQPTETTKYLVMLTVTPKSTAVTGVAQVGSVVTAKTFTEIVTVTVAGSNITQLNGNWVTYSKSISYDSQAKQFCLSLGFKSDTNREMTALPQLPDFTYAPSEDGSSVTQVQTTVIKYSGYYYIEIWGGKGGNGGQSSWFGSAGAAGGDGGYMGGFVYLEKGDILHVHIGANGADGANGTGILAGGKGGEGGEPSAVALMKEENGQHVVDRYIMIAGGGSGGSGGYAGSNKPGVKPSTTDTTISVNTLDEMLAAYKGANGVNGSLSMKEAAAGHNAYDATIYNKNDPAGNNNLGSYDSSEFGSSNHDTKVGGGAFHLTYIQLDTAPDGERATELENYEAEIAISKYFTFTGYEVIDNETETVIDGANAIADSVDSTYTEIHIENIKPPSSTVESGGKKYSSVSFTVNVYVKAHDAFLGGNDVMLIDVTEETKAFTQLATGVRFAQSFENADEETVTGYFDVIENSATDYVNVPIRWETLDEDLLVARNKVHIVDQSAPVALSQLYRVNADLLAELKAEVEARDAWCRDYVTVLEAPIIDDGSGVSGQTDAETQLSPNTTTTYTLTMGIVPNAPSYYAKVTEEASPVVLEKSVTIYAMHLVEFDLAEHIHHTGKDIKYYDPLYSGDLVYVAEVGKDYVLDFSIEEGDFSLPESITVKVGGEDGTALVSGSDYLYDRESERLTVYSSAITGSLYIQADETEIQYNLHYIVQSVENGLPSENGYYEYIVPMWAGDPISAATDCAAAIAGAGISTNLVGYTFSWDWGDGSTTPLEIMPVEDWWIFGTFTPNQYTVQIRYVDTEGRPLDGVAAYVGKVSFGDSLTVVSPSVSGYATGTPSYSATIDAALVATAVDGVINVDVVYESIRNEIVLNLVLENGTIADTCTVVFDFGKQSYTITSAAALSYTMNSDFAGASVSYTIGLPEIVGHHLASQTIAGVLQAGTGESLEILYTANRYTLRFDPDGGTCAETERTVIYGQPYSYDGTAYRAFPSVIKVGSDFLGWVDSNGTTVAVSDIVTVDAENGQEIVLRANWEVNRFTITVQFVYEDGTFVQGAGFASIVDDVAYGATYAYSAPALDGFTATPVQYTGVMPAQNLVLVFTYYEDSSMEELNVTVTWGDLSFSAMHGRWNPEALRYEDDTFTPNTAGNNTVTVFNNSETLGVNAVLSYDSAVGCESIDGYFTAENDARARKTSTLSIDAGARGALYVWLGGEIPEVITTSIPTLCGTVTVTVTPRQ